MPAPLAATTLVGDPIPDSMADRADRPLNIALGWRLPDWLLDYGPVAFVAFVGFAMIAHGPVGVVHPWRTAGPPLVIVLAALLVRRRWPLPTLAIVLAALVVSDYKAVSALPALLAVFNAAEYVDRPRLVAAVAVTVAAVLLGPALHGAELSFTTIIQRMVAVGLAVAAGLYLRTRSDYILGLRDRATRLERERSLLAEHAVTEERVRIARELHDVVAHNVSLMIVQAQALAATGSGDPGQTEALRRIGDLGREAMSEMHRMLGVLRLQDGDAAEREPQPGVRDLDTLVARTREAGLCAELEVSGSPRELSPGIDLSVYRIVQEALTNVIRHAGANQAHVKLSYEPRWVEVTVLDDGHGPNGTVGGGHGLVGMRERATMLGGELTAGARGDGHTGYHVHAVLPAG